MFGFQKGSEQLGETCPYLNGRTYLSKSGCSPFRWLKLGIVHRLSGRQESVETEFVYLHDGNCNEIHYNCPGDIDN